MNTEKIFIFEEKEFSKNKSTQDIRLENDSLGLIAIAKFGWLRAREIGNVLWPTNQTRHTAGARITRRWVKEKLVLERQLPRGFGTAFVLSKKGADFVNFETEYAQEMDPVESGKKIGDHIEQVDGSWIPTRSWRHDLLACGFLTIAMGKGADVYSELEMRRVAERGHANKKGDKGLKIPDGIFKAENSDEWSAIEVERSGKWSNKARSLAREIVDAGTGGIIVLGKKVTRTIIVYEDPSATHLGDKDRAVVNHFERVANQCQAIVPFGMRLELWGAPLITCGGGVVEISGTRLEVIDWSIDAAIDKSVFGHEWEHDYMEKNFSLVVNPRCPFTLRISKGERIAGMFFWEIRIAEHPSSLDKDIQSEKTVFRKTTETDTAKRAQNFAVLQLQKFGPYRTWAAQEISKEFPGTS